MKKPAQSELTEFLRESNAIEGVYDSDSLQQAEIAWDFLMTQKELTPAVVREVHKLLMLHQKLQEWELGRYRTMTVYIGGQAALNAVHIPERMEEWLRIMNLTNIPSETLSRLLHVEYEKIHPFVDGNGRTGRMFMNWQRLRNKLPFIIIHEGDEQKLYYEWFR